MSALLAPPDAASTAPAEPLDDRVLRAGRAAATGAYRWATALLPTRRLVAVVALLAPLWLLGDTPLAWVPWAATLAVVLLTGVDLLTLPARWQLSLERHIGERVGVGDELSGEYVLRTRSRPLRVALWDALPRAVRSAEPRGTWHALRPHSPAEPDAMLVVPFTVTGVERGTHELGPAVVRVLGRVRLVQRSVRFAPPDAITVVPSMSGVRHFRLLTVQHRLREAGIRAIRRRGDGTSFASLREYVLGDDPRRIDWKATARRQKLIAREYNVEQGQTVMIAVDAGRMMTQLAGGVPRFEYALSSATLLADVAAQSGDHVGLLLFDEQVRAFVPPTRGRPALERIRSALIPARATLSEPDYASAFRLLAERHRKRSLIVLFTDVIDPRSSQAVIAHTTRGAARHLLLVVALRNDALMASAVPDGHGSSTTLYEAAAAEELVLARDEALVRMRRAGVSVLDVSPHAMTAAVVNRYLELKARSAV